MVQWTSYLFIKGMTLWNTLTDWFSYVSYYVVDFSKYVSFYFHKDHTTWYLLPGHSLPLSHKYIKNDITPEWKYSASRYVLEQCNPQKNTYIYPIHWLSASLCIQSHHDQKKDEYSMDHFLNECRVISDGSLLPSLRHLFLIWCIHTHHWFSSEDKITFQIIDANGEFKTYSIDDPSISFEIYRNKLQIKSNNEEIMRP